eukprot:m.231554 g.231554  ORF g.231554 m.231554 type:complete len:166 (-) comp18402_c0_seq1:23-520(-)
MGRLRKKRMHKNDRSGFKKRKTARRTRDVDQIQEDLKKEQILEILRQPADGDLPGSGEFYCIHCAKHFTDSTCFNHHLRSKRHKQQAKLLQEPQYTQAEAEAAAGLGTYKKAPAVVVPLMENVQKLRGALKDDSNPDVEGILAEHPAAAALPLAAAAAAAAPVAV